MADLGPLRGLVVSLDDCGSLTASYMGTEAMVTLTGGFTEVGDLVRAIIKYRWGVLSNARTAQRMGMRYGPWGCSQQGRAPHNHWYKHDKSPMPPMSPPIWRHAHPCWMPTPPHEGPVHLET